MKPSLYRIGGVLLGLLLAATMRPGVQAQDREALPRLRVGPEGRFLVQEDGDVFVWVGDTNWFFAELDPTQRNQILDKRQAQGFTVMFVSARELLYDGRGGPYDDGDITDLNAAWWDYLEAYVDEAAARGLYVGVALGWWGHVLRNEAADLYTNGVAVAQRLTGKTNVIWLVAGEAGGHHRKTEIPNDKMEAIIQGIRDGDADGKLLTIHADYRRGTSLTDDAALVDFNNWQTSQWCCRDDLPRKDERAWTVWEAIAYDYAQSYDTPSGAKPTIDSEPWYENNKDFCGTTPFIIRRRAYFTLLAGAFGVHYGAGGIWDALTEPEGCSGTALQALAYDGADDLRHLSALLHDLGNDLLKLRPNQAMIVGGQSADYDAHVQAAQATDGSYALVYDADGGTLSLDLTGLAAGPIRACWMDPRDGTFTETRASYSNRASAQVVTAPSSDHDWVLVLQVEPN